MRKTLFPPAVLTLVLLGVVAGCQKHEDNSKAPAAVPVTLAPVTVQDLPEIVTAIGNVEPLASVAIKSRVDGQIVEVMVRDGQDVQRGQLLFQIDPRPFQLQIAQVEATLARDRALLDTATAQEARYRDLLAQKYISQDGYAQVKASKDVAAANLQTDEVALANAKLQLEFTRIHAPISGRLGKVTLARGNLVKANDTNTMALLNQIHPIYVSFSVPEQILSRVREAMKRGALSVHALSREDASVDEMGTLSFVDNAVDAATGTIRLRATFQNLNNRLWPGQFVNVQLQLGTLSQVRVVPSVAVQTGPKGPYVFTVGGDGKAMMREVKIGSVIAQQTIIADGINAGEQVVVDGQSRLTSGASIRAKPTTPEAASTVAP